MRRGLPPARPFDCAQGERPYTGGGDHPHPLPCRRERGQDYHSPHWGWIPALGGRNDGWRLGGWGVSSGLSVRAIGQWPLREVDAAPFRSCDPSTPLRANGIPPLDSRSEAGMIRLGRTGFPRGGGVGEGGRGGLAVVGRPTLDSSTGLRVSGPTPGRGSPSP